LDTGEKLIPSPIPLRTQEKGLPLKRLQRESLRNAHIRVGEFSSESAERYFVVNEIKGSIDQGIKPNEIAVLYRNNRQAFGIARDLARLGVPYQIESDQDLFSQGDVERLLIILRAVAEYGNDIYITPLLHLSIFEIDPLDAYKTIRSASDKRKYILYDLLQNEKLLKDANLSNARTVLALGAKLKAWVKQSKEKDLLAFFEHIIRDSGILEDILSAPDSMERFSAIDSLFDEMRQFTERSPSAKLKEFFVYLDTIKKHRLFIKRSLGGASPERSRRVRLMTVHRAKGLEFSHVYIIHATDGTFGGQTNRDKLPLIDSIYNFK